MSEYKNMSELKEAFYKTKRRVRGIDLAVKSGVDFPNLKGGYFYLNDLVWIAELSDIDAESLGGRYYVAIERQEYVNDDLDTIECILIENWCAYEFLQDPFDDDYRIQNDVNDLMINESEEK